jgi:RiboL-PSP-HEPN
MSRILVRRFKELEDQLSPLMPLSFGLQVSGLAETKQSVAEDFLLNWSVKAKNIIVKSCGEDSQHFKEFEKAQKRTSFDNTFSALRRLAAVFLAAKEDFEGGYVKSFKSLIQAEVFDDELEQATELLNSGYQSAAAVIAGTVLESTLRSQCLAQNIPLGKMDKMNSDLTKAGVYNSLVQKRITAMAAVRNSAAHGKNTDFTSSDVKSMIDDVRRYIEQHMT